MREFLILLKYLSNPYINTSRKKSNTNISRRFFNQLIGYLIGSVPLGAFVFIFSNKIFQQLYAVDQLAAKYLFLFWITLLSLFFAVGFIGLAMYSLSRNDEIELLLTMPISRSTLTSFQIFSATISQIYVLVFFIAISLAYFLSVKENILLGVFKILIHIAFLIIFSSNIAILIGGKTSKSFTRRFYMIILLLSMFFYFFIIALVDVEVDKLQNFAKMMIFSSQEYNFLGWAFISNKTFVYSIIATILLSISFSYISKQLAFEPVQTTKKKDFKIKGSGSVFKAVIRKDLKAAIRYEQFLYFILYPIGFSIFMMFLNEQEGLYIFTIPIFTFYIALETAILLVSEVSKIELSLVYPIKLRTLLFPKIFIPVGLNFSLLLGIYVVSGFIFSFQLLNFIGLLFSLLLFIMSSILGAYFALKSKNVSINNMNRIFSVPQIFIIEGITFGLGFAIIIPLGMLIQNGMLKWWEWTIMLSGIFATILISYLFLKGLKKEIQKKLS